MYYFKNEETKTQSSQNCYFDVKNDASETL